MEIKEDALILFDNHHQNNQVTLDLPSEAKCPFYTFSSIKTTQDHPRPKSLIYLEIQGQNIIQRQDPQSQIILSHLTCNYEQSVEILQKQQGSIEDEQKQAGPLMKSIGLRFKLNEGNNQTKITNLLVQQCNLERLQYFLSTLKKKKVIQQHNLFNFFKPDRRLGVGNSSSVYSVTEINSNIKYAIKSVKKEQTSLSKLQTKRRILNQIRVWSDLDHKNISKLHQVYQFDNSIHMITDQYSDSLFSLIKENGFLKRPFAENIIRELFEAVQHMHKKGYMHRDIKPQNIMIAKNKLNNEMIPVLVDFGISERFDKQKLEIVRCGTPGYTAPQILQIDPNDIDARYSQLCDVFSLGVLSYILLLQKFPFKAPSVKQITLKNLQCNIDLRQSMDSNPLLLDFLSKMLAKDPKLRCSISEALNHPFIREKDQPVITTTCLFPIQK